MKLLRLLNQAFKYLIKNPKDILSPSSFYRNVKKFKNRLLSKTENSNFYNPFIKSEYPIKLDNILNKYCEFFN